MTKSFVKTVISSSLNGYIKEDKIRIESMSKMVRMISLMTSALCLLVHKNFGQYIQDMIKAQIKKLVLTCLRNGDDEIDVKYYQVNEGDTNNNVTTRLTSKRLAVYIGWFTFEFVM